MKNEELNISSVEDIPGYNMKALFSSAVSVPVFREDKDIPPVPLDEKTSYIPWGADNRMPYDIINLIEKDETLATCQEFNAEACYGAGLEYNTDSAADAVKRSVSDFLLDNNIPDYFLGVCKDLKHFAFAVSVIILNADASKIVRLSRKEACYCRFAPADASGRIPFILFANWRRPVSSLSEVEKIELLDPVSPWADLKSRLESKSRTRKFAIVTKIPSVDSTYYPIPYYASLFRGEWYKIKQIIGLAKKSKLQNSAPIKYHIEISGKYWDQIFRREAITDPHKRQLRVIKEKQQIIEFLTGAENSGKVLFSEFYISPDGREQHDVVITKIDDSKEGGDWQTDLQEAVNMICFSMRVHSNLVGSVPGKSQSNNSGSDKRELYTISQALQKPYHDILFTVHRIIIRFNGWNGVSVSVPFMQLTTLDEHRDVKKVSPDNPQTS